MIRLKPIKVKENSRVIASKVRAAKQKWMEQFGKDVAEIASDSMKRVAPNSPQVSRPGGTPFVRSPKINLTSFSTQIVPGLVRVGVVRSVKARASLGYSVPTIMESGGVARSRPRERTAGRRHLRRTKPHYIRKRPYVYPAGIAALNRLRSNAKDSIR